MTSEARILYSEGQPKLFVWDNKIEVSYPLSNSDMESLQNVLIKGEEKSEMGSLLVKKTNIGSNVIVKGKLSGSNTSVTFILYSSLSGKAEESTGRGHIKNDIPKTD